MPLFPTQGISRLGGLLDYWLEVKMTGTEMVQWQYLMLC